MKIYILVFLALFILTSCSDDSSSNDSSSKSSTKIAYFYDSLTNGVSYKCDDISGITGDVDNKNGSFRYNDNCNIVFSVGKIHIGTLDPKNINTKTNKIYPSTILGLNTINSNDKRVVNILRFLQTLDTDSDASNGIVISTTTRNNLSLTSANSIDLTNINLTEEELNDSIIQSDSNKSLISKTKAISHFENTLRTYVDKTVDTVGPPKPYLDKNITSINNKDTKTLDIIINGEENSYVYLAFNKDGNTSNLDFKPLNIKIGSSQKADYTLQLNDNSISYFHYYIKLIDIKNHESEILHIKILKDFTPPSVLTNNLIINVIEQQHFIQNINATDTFNLRYQIISNTEDNRSINHNLFQIDSNGSITFINEPDFDDNINASFKLVARALDEASNMTDVFLTINLLNILDNPPKLINTSYTTNFIEELTNDTIIFDANTSVQTDLTIAPDNNKILSPIIFKLHNHNDKFNIDEINGLVTIKDNLNDFFDYEASSLSLDLNISVENNNTSDSGNKTYFKLHIDLLNKIDTTPFLVSPSSVSINEHNNPAIIEVAQIQKDIQKFDKNQTMTFSIISGDNGDFTIDSSTGVVKTTGDTLDFETKNEYNLTIRATNTWFDGNLINNIYDVNLIVNINNVIDNAPSIQSDILHTTLEESTNSDFIVAYITTNGSIYDQNQTTQFILEANTPFKINNTGTVSTSSSLLDEHNETNIYTTFTLNITAENKSWDNTTLISNLISFDINITNVIDHAPVLINPSTTLYFEENTSTPLGTTIYTIETNGSNYDESNVSKYSIINGNENATFSINPNTGEIKLAKLFDFESKSSYTLSLNASNIKWNGDEQNSSNIDLNISVNNIAEKVPLIKGVLTLDIHENIDSGYTIMQIETNSTNIDEKIIDTFSIVSGNDNNFMIIKDENTGLPIGLLKTSHNSSFDFNTSVGANNTYILDVNATNDAGSSSHRVTINLIDDVDTDLPLLVIALDYNDTVLISTDETIHNLIFGTQFGELNDYFYRVSKEKFRFKQVSESNNANDGIIRINMGKNYPDGTNSNTLVNDLIYALNSSDNSIDYSIYDKDSDGNISKSELQILFLVAGGEKTYNDTFPSLEAKTSSFSSDITLDGVKIASTSGNANYVVAGETNAGVFTTFGLIAKHLAHSALGFPYLGDKTLASKGIGFFGLMGYGYLGATEDNVAAGSTPINISAFNVLSQGWVTPTIIYNSTTNIELIASNKGPAGFNILKVPLENTKNYYLIENRILTTSTGYDNGFYAMESKNFEGGLAIWKIDEDKTSNDSVNAKMVDLIEYKDDVTDFEYGMDNGSHNGKSSYLYKANSPTPLNINFEISNSTFNESNDSMTIDIEK